MNIKSIFLVFFLLLSFTPLSAAEGAEWTIMVYLDGDNNLEFAGIEDINEMESIPTSDQVNIVVLEDRYLSESNVFLIQEDDNPQIINSPVLEVPSILDGEVNMGDPRVLEAFIEFSKTNYPANHYMLILWDHGTGWSDYGDPDVETEKSSVVEKNTGGGIQELTKGICFDETSNDVLTQNELQSVLIDHPVDILGFDACLMGYVEVAYDFMGMADYVLFSPETEPADGYPYDDMLSYLSSNYDKDVEEIGSQFAEIFVQSYNMGSQGNDLEVTMSFVKTSSLSAVADETTALANLLIPEVGSIHNQISDAIEATDYFADQTAVDYIGFLQNLKSELAGYTSITSQIDTTITAVESSIIAHSHLSGHETTGMSIYLPQYDGMYDGNYDIAIDWSADTTWDEFLLSYTQAHGDFLVDWVSLDSGGLNANINQGSVHGYRIDVQVSSNPVLVEIQLEFSEYYDFDLYLVDSAANVLAQSLSSNPEFISYLVRESQDIGVMISAYSGSGQYTLSNTRNPIPELSDHSGSLANEQLKVFYLDIEVHENPIILDLELSFSSSNDFDLYLFSFQGMLDKSDTLYTPETLEYVFDYNITVLVYIYSYSGSGSYSLDLSLSNYDLAAITVLSSSLTGSDSNSDSLYDGLGLSLGLQSSSYGQYFMLAEFYVMYQDIYIYLHQAIISSYISTSGNNVFMSVSSSGIDLIIGMLGIDDSFSIVVMLDIYDDNVFLIESTSLEFSGQSISNFATTQVNSVDEAIETGYLQAGNFAYYSFPVLPGDVVYVSLTGSYGTDFDIEVLLMDSYQLLGFSQNTEYPEAFSFVSDFNGTILLAIYSYSGSGDYSLSVTINGNIVGSPPGTTSGPYPTNTTGGPAKNTNTNSANYPSAFLFILLGLPVLSIVRRKFS